MLFARTLKTNIKGECIFNALQELLCRKGDTHEKHYSFRNRWCTCYDWASQRFHSISKKIVPDVFAIQCVIHRQHLSAKELSPKLHKSLQFLIQVINKIKASTLNDRLFRTLCHEKEEEFER